MQAEIFKVKYVEMLKFKTNVRAMWKWSVSNTRNFVDMKTFEQRSIVNNAGKDIHVCPCVQSTICLKDAVKKLQKKVIYGINWN